MNLGNKIREAVESLRTGLLGGSRLKGHLLRGGTWLGIGGVSEQLFRFARNIVLTRLLAPEAFGIMAIVYSTSYVVDSFAQIGMKEAIIQNPKGHEPSYVNSAWWLGFVRGVGIYALMFTIAPWVGSFYGHAELTPLMRTALLGIVFTGAQSPKAFVALKEMKFKKWTIIQSASGLLGSMIVVLLAFAVRSVWALAIGYAAENLIRCVVSYALCPFRPRAELDKDAVRGLLAFSRGVFGLSFLNLIFSRADIFVLGKMYPASDLGVYTMAVYLVQVPTSFVIGVLSQTLLPSFAQMQDDNSRMNGIVNRVTAILVILGLPALIFIVLSSSSILSVVYGPRYLAAASILTIAALVALVDIINNVITVIFYAIGRPQFHRRCVLVMAVVMLVLIYPAVKQFGLLGGQIAALVAIIAGFASQLLRLGRLTGLDLSQYGRTFPFTLAVSLGVLLVTLVMRHFWSVSNPMASLVSGLLACGLTLVVFSKQLIRQVASKPSLNP